MTKNYPGELWKPLMFDFAFTNDCRIEISTFGRIRTFNKVSDGNIINGSMINGYRILRLKFYSPREEKVQKKFDYLQQQVFKLARKLKSVTEAGESPETVKELSSLLEASRKSLTKQFQNDLKERTINFQSLIHRLVAEAFIKKPSSKHIIVAHKDHDKVNNRVGNLRWMTPEENYEHQKSSPHVIAEKNSRQHRRKESSRATKLTVTKVMLLKKMLNQGKPMKQLVKQFKVTDTQILRIKRGENWADIQAAT